MSFRQVLVRVNTLLAVFLLCSCSSISYYGQSISGQLQVLRTQRDFSEVYADSSIPEHVKNRLRSITEIRNFASESLLLPDNDSYRKYADIGRRYIVWNVFAAPRLSLVPHQSCFFVVGCLSYRGYFHRKDAMAYMQQLENQGFDVYLGGVSAYSTLGWFDDPILNGMLERSNVELARLIFHELAHQRLYLRDDSEFNEAFAEAVARIGVHAWLDSLADDAQSEEFAAMLKREKQFHQLVLSYREKLEAVYSSARADSMKLEEKRHTLAAMRAEYEQLRLSWGGEADYDNWMKQVNNARIAAVSTYQSLVPDFLRVYRRLGRDLDSFYAHMEALSGCSAGQRRAILVSGQLSNGCPAK